jgi:hypothetical protein
MGMKKSLMRSASYALSVGLLGVCLLATSGCAYSLQGKVRKIFHSEKGVFVPVFTNNTDEVGAEVIFTNAVVRELGSRGQIVVTNRQEGALELRGVVTSINYGPSTFGDAGLRGLKIYRRLPSEIVVDCNVSIALVDPKSGNTLWSSGFSSFRRVPMPLNRTYDFQAPSSIGLITQGFIQSQYPLIARDISRDIYDSMLAEEG